MRAVRSEGAGKPDQQNGLVLQPAEVVEEYCNHLAHIEQEWRLAVRRTTSVAPDAAHRALDLWIFGRQRMAGLFVVIADTRQPAFDGRDRIRVDQGDGVGAVLCFRCSKE